MNSYNRLGAIQVVGPDAEKFLQGQLTCDVHTLSFSGREAPESGQLGAYCNQQGRVQATFRLFPIPDGYRLQLPLEMVQPTLALLTRYALFSKITITETDAVNVHPDWPLTDIQAGIAMIYPETVGLFTPNMLNYPALGGVSFNKGCYLGQEVVARTHYLGAPKKQLYRAEIVTDQRIKPGDQMTGGVIVNAYGAQILAVLSNEAVQQGDLLFGDKRVILIP